MVHTQEKATASFLAWMTLHNKKMVYPLCANAASLWYGEYAYIPDVALFSVYTKLALCILQVRMEQALSMSMSSQRCDHLCCSVW